MSQPKSVKHVENLHIIFWLIKDTCWMLELKWQGTIMMVPTISLAVYFLVKSFKTPDVYSNAAILFWILANSFWMMMEFFNDSKYKHFAAIPFGLGILMIIILYCNNFRRRKDPNPL